MAAADPPIAACQLLCRSAVAIGRRMDDSISATILRVLERAPQWIRHDLEAKDDAIRARAEETLAAMIANALQTGTSASPEA
ncbi:DUF6771 family protein [Novosphingobium gossypii]|uniref:DUF6771 family protein n=1 Tax=Novosphingobium gossypii TaxID=1604774 RepID=UPI003D23864F